MSLISRFVHAGLTVSQWPQYIQEIHRILKPGDGWAQMIELGYPYVISANGTLPKQSSLSKVKFSTFLIMPAIALYTRTTSRQVANFTRWPLSRKSDGRSGIY